MTPAKIIFDLDWNQKGDEVKWVVIDRGQGWECGNGKEGGLERREGRNFGKENIK